MNWDYTALPKNKCKTDWRWNKTLCVFAPAVERSGSKGEGAEEFHWFNFFFFHSLYY